jgi:hypothetical protein
MRIGMVTPKVKSMSTNLANGFMIRRLSEPDRETSLEQRSWF